MAMTRRASVPSRQAYVPGNLMVLSWSACRRQRPGRGGLVDDGRGGELGAGAEYCLSPGRVVVDRKELADTLQFAALFQFLQGSL